MDRVQLAVILFSLMGIVVAITILVAILPYFKKPKPQKNLPEASLKEQYENALKKGDTKEIMRVGRKYYATLRSADEKEPERKNILPN